MQVGQRIERRLADHEQVHQLAVVRQQRVVPALRRSGGRSIARRGCSASACADRPAARSSPRRRTAGRGRTGCRSTLRQSTTGCRPTATSAARSAMPAMPRRARRRRTASGSTPGGSTLSRTALPMMVSRPAVRNTPSAAEHARRATAASRARPSPARRTGHDDAAARRTGRRPRRPSDTTMAVMNQSSVGVQLGIAGNRRRALGRRRALQPDVPLTGADGHVMSPAAWSRRATRTATCARPGNHAGQPHADAHVVGSGLAGEERVGAADVRHRQRSPARAAAPRARQRRHRCTRAIQLPHHRPQRADDESQRQRDRQPAQPGCPADSAGTSAPGTPDRRCTASGG